MRRPPHRHVPDNPIIGCSGLCRRKYRCLSLLLGTRQDAKECIALEPSFIKGYSRKGHLEFFMKDYDAALETYEVCHAESVY